VKLINPGGLFEYPYQSSDEKKVYYHLTALIFLETGRCLQWLKKKKERKKERTNFENEHF
jgi:hypothetical protein